MDSAVLANNRREQMSKQENDLPFLHFVGGAFFCNETVAVHGDDEVRKLKAETVSGKIAPSTRI